VGVSDSFSIKDEVSAKPVQLHSNFTLRGVERDKLDSDTTRYRGWLTK